MVGGNTSLRNLLFFNSISLYLSNIMHSFTPILKLVSLFTVSVLYVFITMFHKCRPSLPKVEYNYQEQLTIESTS